MLVQNSNAPYPARQIQLEVSAIWGDTHRASTGVAWKGKRIRQEAKDGHPEWPPG